ncbi:hypothetical protein Tco_1168918, partial [Tanacetum coccineum]
THFDADTDMFGVHDLDGDEVLAEPEVTIKDVNLSVDEVTLAQAFIALKTVSTRPRAKGLVIHEEEQATTPTVSSQQPSHVKAQDKGKGIMVKEPVKMKKKDQISLDEELAFKLQAEEEEERLAREKAQRKEEANIQKNKKKLSIEEKSKLFAQLLEARKKHFAAMRAQEERNKPPTKEQKAATQEHKEVLREQEKIFNKSLSRSKRWMRIKKQQRLIEVVPDKEEVAIDAIPLATKPPSIVDYKIHKEGKKTYYQIIRADGSSKMYLVFSHILKSFDREDLNPMEIGKS